MPGEIRRVCSGKPIENGVHFSMVFFRSTVKILINPFLRHWFPRLCCEYRDKGGNLDGRGGRGSVSVMEEKKKR